MRRWVSHELLCETQQCEEETSFYTVEKHRSSTVSDKTCISNSHMTFYNAARQASDAAPLC